MACFDAAVGAGGTKSGYDDIAIGRGDLIADLAHAEAITAAVRAAL